MIPLTDRDWRPAAAGAALAAFWYAGLITGFDFDLLRNDHRGLLFNAMLLNMLQGRFDVPPAIIGEEGFLHAGLVYAYFGIFPALLRLPLLLHPAAFGTDVTKLSSVFAAALAVYWQLRAISLLRVRLAGTPAEALTLALAIGVIFGGPHAQFMRSSIYEEVMHWAMGFAALFVWQALRGLDQGFSFTILARLGLAAGLAFITRVSTGAGLIAALGGLLLVLSWPGGWRPLAWLQAALARRFLIPVAIVAPFVAITLGVNWARWGNPLVVIDLAAHIMNARYPDRLPRILATGEFNLTRVPFGLMYYFAPVWPLYWPGGGLMFQAYQQRMVEAELPPASFLLTDPVMLVLAGLFVARARRMGAAALTLAAGLLLPVALMLGLVFMNFRYRQEFYPLLLFAALAALLRTTPPMALRRHAMTLTWISVAFAHGFLVLYLLSRFGPADVTVVQVLLRRLGF